MRIPFISVMGTMGSGKTTAANLLAKTFDYQLVEENFKDNLFLPRFYKDMKRWAFHSQTFFLLEKIQQLQEIGKTLRNKKHQIKGIIQDTPIEQDAFSYAKAQADLGNIDQAEWILYQKIYNLMKPVLPKPDAIVFLNASISEICRRIKSRGRGFEQKIPQKYLALLDKNNQVIVKKFFQRKIIIINTNHLNIADSAKDQDIFIHLVMRKIKIN